MLTVMQVAVIGCLICTTLGFILGYRTGKDIWRCKREDRCRSNVNLTNGSFDEKGIRIDGYKELKVKTPAKFCTCKECGNQHIIEQEIYELPKV